MKKYILLIAIFISTQFANGTEPLKIINFYSRSSTNGISLCFRTNRYFLDVSAQKLKPYIRLSPSQNFRVSPYYDEVCIKGLKPQTTYTVDINKNIPLGKIRLDKSYKFTQKTGNYKPSFSFKESGYILPLYSDIAIPLESRNLKEVEVSLYRVNRNNLMMALNSSYLHTSLSRYELNQLEREDGYKLWSKRLKLNTPQNKKVITAIELKTMLKKPNTGLYILAVAPIDKEGETNNYSVKTQSFVLSDIGLFTMQGTKALHIYVKHLKDASLYKNCKLELIAKNNEVLSTTVAKNGYATFDASLLKGVKSLTPKAIYAYGENGDFAIIDISKAPLDLTDRGDSGQEPIEGYNAFIFSNRSIFKPNTTVAFHTIIRDKDEQIASNLKVSVKLIDPEDRVVSKKLLTTDSLGHFDSNFTLPKKAGRYTIEIYASSKEPIGKLGFSVEDFIPPKIEAITLAKPSEIKPQSSATIKLQAKYLTGEALPNPKGSYALILHTIKSPLKEYSNYLFGKYNEPTKSEYIDEKEFAGDSNGTIKINLTKLTKSPNTRPLGVYVKATIQDPGSRAIYKIVDIPFNDKEGYIGIKPQFKDDAIDLNSKANFMVVYIANSKLVTKELSYKLIKQVSHWNWRSAEGDDWEYYRTYEDIAVVQKGTIKSANQPTILSLNRLDWGSYRLEIRDEFNNITTYHFSSGYQESKSKVSPDKLPISIDKKVYKVGDTLKVQINPKFSGPLIVNIASNKILETKELQAKANEPLELTFKTKKEWGSSVYVLATQIRANNTKLGATRAVGLANFAINDPQSYIDLSLNYPKKIKSKSKLKVEVSTKSAKNQEVYLTLMAVDKGVLNLTRFKTPNPTKHFFGKRKLGIKLRDIYAKLIRSYGQHAEFSVGAGEEDAVISNTTPTPNMRKVVALMSQAIKLDKNGKAFVEFDIPDFQGKLKLMAIAWSKKGVGSTDGLVVVKDPLSLELYMPSFLSIKDSAKVLLQAKFDKDAPIGDYKLKITTNGVVGVNENEISYTISSPKVVQTPIELSALKEGVGTIKIEALNGKKVVASREFKLATRAPYPKGYTNSVGLIEPNTILDTKTIANTNSWQNISHIKVDINSAPVLGVDGIKKELLAYCCRCAEQTTSRAFAFLNDSEQKELINSAISRLYDLQKYDGGFGLWQSSNASQWATSYVVDFLTEAKRRGFSVNKQRLESGLKYLENHLSRWSKNSLKVEADAYALYVLAKNKYPLLSEINYHINNTNSPIKSASGWAYLASALATLGKNKSAKEIFNLAKKHLNNNYWGNYGGILRDKALLVTLANQAGFKEIAQPLFIDLALDRKEHKYLSTQEMSLLLRASKEVDILSSKLNLEINNTPYSGKKFSKTYSNINELPNIKNLGTNAIWYSISFVATPKPKYFNIAQNRGFSITKEFFTTQGKKVDLNNIKQGSQIVVVLKGEIEDSLADTPIIIDFLPAGFEIENPNISGYDVTKSLNWLPHKSIVLNQEYRNDRFICAISSDKNFTQAYTVRAVTKGKFILAPTIINDMYKPKFRAFSKNSTYTITIKDAKVISTPKEQNNTKKELSSNDYEVLFNSPIGSLNRYTTLELNRLRNGIFAKVGLNFKNSNPELHRLFSKFKWYNPTLESGAVAYSKLTPLQKSNVQALLKEEKHRLGSLTLNDFYRVHAVALNKAFFKHFNIKQLKILRNSLIARYGYIFKDKELNKIFNNLPWYKPIPNTSTEKIIDTQMSQIERSNLNKIIEVEKE